MLLFGVPGDDVGALRCIILWAGVAFLCATFSAFITPSKPDPKVKEPSKVLKLLFWELLFLGVAGTIISLIPYGTIHDALIPFILLLALAPIPIMLYDPTETADLRAPGEGLDEGLDEGLVSAPDLPPRSEALFESLSLSLYDMLKTPDAWCLWWTGVVIIGGGNMVVTNMSQIITAAGASDSLIPTMVTIFGTGNMLGNAL